MVFCLPCVFVGYLRSVRYSIADYLFLGTVFLPSTGLQPPLSGQMVDYQYHALERQWRQSSQHLGGRTQPHNGQDIWLPECQASGQQTIPPTSALILSV